MDPVEIEIRNAIAARGSLHIDVRNQVYQAAQSAIDRMPEPGRKSAQARLFAAIKSIEEQFVHGAVNNGSRTGKKHYSLLLLKDRFANVIQERVAAGLQLTFVQVATATLCLIALLAFLVGGFAMPDRVSSSAKSNVADGVAANSDSGLRVVYSIDFPDDLERISIETDASIGDGKTAFQIADGKIYLEQYLSITGSEFIPFESEKIYLMTIEMGMDPADTQVVINAGISTHDKSGKKLENGTGGDSYFLNSGLLTAEQDPASAGEIQLIGIIDWADPAFREKVNQDLELFKPVIVVDFPVPGAKVWIRRIAIEEVI